MEQNKSPEIDPHKYSQLVFNKGAKEVKQSKGSLFKKCCWDNWTSTCKKNECRYRLFMLHINSTWIIDLNVKHETIKFLEDNIGENLHHLGYGDAFLDATPKAQSMKEIIYELNFIKVKKCMLCEGQLQNN